MSNQKTGIIAGSLAAIALIAGFFWMQSSSEKVSPLHVYYPQYTTFYVEAEPGEALTKRMLHWLEEQDSIKKAALAKEAAKPKAAPATAKKPAIAHAKPAAKHPAKKAAPAKKVAHAKPAAKPATKHPAAAKAAEPVKPGQDIKTIASQAEDDAFKRALFDKFDTTFEPHISLGAWTQPDAKAKSATDNSMVILPLKQDTTFPKLLERFNGTKHTFENFTENNVTYYVDKTPGAGQNTFAIIHKNLFIASNPAVMKDTVQHLNKKQDGRTDDNVFDHPTNKRYLKLLDKNRDGTLIINNTSYAEQLKSLSKAAPGAIPQPLQDRVLLYSNVTPLTLGALHVNKEQQISTEFFMPLNLKALKNDKLAEEIQALYTEKKALSAAKSLPANTTFLLNVQSFDRWYDLYQHHLMPQTQQAQIQQAAMLLSLVQLNWRNDVVGLFSNEIAFASVAANPIPIVLLESDEKKEQSFNKLMTIVTSGKFLPLPHHEEQVDDVTVNTFAIPRQNQQVSVGSIDKKLIAFAQSGDFANVVKVTKKKEDSLAKDKEFKALTKGFPKDMALFFYSDVEANQDAFQHTLRQTRVSSNNKATIQLAEKLSTENKANKMMGVSKMAAALWAQPKGNEEDLVQAKVVLQLKPES